MAQRVVIIGGGLAGMTIAKELRKRDVDVVILEASQRMGGKAGADYREDKGVYVEHGYHVFPAWYLNVRALLRELGIEDTLIDLHQSENLRQGDFPNYRTFREVSSFWNVIRNTFSGLMPWPLMVSLNYYYLDLASQRLSRRGFLDRISANGFLHSRFYNTEALASFHQQQALQATSVPSYQISAMTMHLVINKWLRYPSPFLSILNGNLQTVFIDPFEQRLRELGTDIQFGTRIKAFQFENHRVAGLRLCDDTVLPDMGPDDMFVVTTPQEVTRTFVDDDFYAAEHASPPSPDSPGSLSGLTQLTSAPMASLTLFLNRKIKDLPKAHVFLGGSGYKMSFIDVTAHWDEVDQQKYPTVLNLIASDFETLKQLSDDKKADYLIDELLAYLPTMCRQDIAWHDLHANEDAPLLLNTVGSWPFRPKTRTRIANLYVAGDFCQCDADLTTMEGAVASAMATARDMLKDMGMATDIGPIPLESRSRWLLRLMRVALMPVIAIVALFTRLQTRPPQS